MRKHARTITADELFRMPDDGFKYELIAGALIKMSPPGSEHGIVGLRLGAALLRHVDHKRLGVVFGTDTGFKLASDPDTVRAPDVAYVARERIPASGIPKGYWPGAPDLAVEVVSPNDRRPEIEKKTAEYFSAGAQEVWVVDPTPRIVTVHRPDAPSRVLRDNDVLESPRLLPGFRYDLANLWRLDV